MPVVSLGSVKPKHLWIGLWAILWGQTQLVAEGGIGLIQRIPVAKKAPWSDVLQARGGPKRVPGPLAYGGISLRHMYHPKRFAEIGLFVRGLALREAGRQERFFYGMGSVRLGWKIDTTERPLWVWGGIAASLLLSAQSRPAEASIYRFADYFGRSQLHLQAGIEKTLRPHWQVGLQILWDLTPAWDRVLFQASRTLAHHLSLSPYLRYQLWAFK